MFDNVEPEFGWNPSTQQHLTAGEAELCLTGPDRTSLIAMAFHGVTSFELALLSPVVCRLVA